MSSSVKTRQFVSIIPTTFFTCKISRKFCFLKNLFFFRMARRFEIDGPITRQYRRFNAVGTQITVRLLPPSSNVDPVTHFLASVNDLFEHVLQNVSDSDIVGMTIHNQVNESDMPIGIGIGIIRRRDMECF